MGRATKMNNLTSPELIAQVLPANKSLQKEFLEYLKGINRSPTTIAGYKNDLDIFFTWVMQECANKPFQKITKRDLVRYQSWLINENENSSSRVRRLRSAISSMSNYIENIIADEDDEFTGFRSIVKKIEAPPLEKTRDKTVWEEQEVINLLTALVSNNQYEKACFLALAVYSGRRKSELFRYQISHFDKEHLIADGKLYLTPKIKTKGRGRDGKQLNTYCIASGFQPYFDLWMGFRKENGIVSEWLFPDPTDMTKPRSPSISNSWVATFAKISGRECYIHSFRHYSCTQLLKAGVPDSVVVEMFGWASAEMLKTYDDRPASDMVEKSVEKLF